MVVCSLLNLASPFFTLSLDHLVYPRHSITHLPIAFDYSLHCLSSCSLLRFLSLCPCPLVPCIFRLLNSFVSGRLFCSCLPFSFPSAFTFLFSSFSPLHSRHSHCPSLMYPCLSALFFLLLLHVIPVVRHYIPSSYPNLDHFLPYYFLGMQTLYETGVFSSSVAICSLWCGDCTRRGFNQHL